MGPLCIRNARLAPIREMTTTAPPTIAIVGRPNVGKSSLLNRLAGRRISIVEPTAGVTRDRVEVPIEVHGHALRIVDTGGIGIVDEAGLADHIERQIQQALVSADLIVFLVDARDGAIPLDRDVSRRLRRLKKPVLLVANKCDSVKFEHGLAGEFFGLGFGEPLALSALEGYGRTDLVEAILGKLGLPLQEPGEDDEDEDGEDEDGEDRDADEAAGGTDDDAGDGPEVTAPPATVRLADGGPSNAVAIPLDRPLRIAVVGRRNVGKSTFVNAILGEERVIVSDVPGTTRDSVDAFTTFGGEPLVLIDTAGLRKRGKSDGPIEDISHHRSREAIRRSDVALLILDATHKISEVDRKIAHYVVDLERACVIVGNKWDLAEGEMSLDRYVDYVAKSIPGLAFAPLVCMSAAVGENILGPIKVARDLSRQARIRVPTGELNRIVRDVLTIRRPKRGRRGIAPKLYYVTQTGVSPITIVLFVNKPALFTDDWRRFLANKLREVFPFSEVPIRLSFRERESFYEKDRKREDAAPLDDGAPDDDVDAPVPTPDDGAPE